MTPRCAERAAGLLGRYARELCTVSSADAAEMTKLLENTFRAVNIALVNELADACRVLRLDVMEVIRRRRWNVPSVFQQYVCASVRATSLGIRRTSWIRARLLAVNAIATRPGGSSTGPEVLSDRGRGLAGADMLVLGVAYKPESRICGSRPLNHRGLLAAARVRYHDPRVPGWSPGRDETAERRTGPGRPRDRAHPAPGPRPGRLRDGQLLLDATYPSPAARERGAVTRRRTPPIPSRPAVGARALSLGADRRGGDLRRRHWHVGVRSRTCGDPLLPAYLCWSPAT